MVTTPPIQANSPDWFQRWAQTLATNLHAIPQSPVVLFSLPTTELPPAANWRGSIMYDSTLDKLIYSDGSAWNAV